jgi:hypothetical protein
MYETGSTQEELAETYDLENPVIEHTETKNFFDHTGLFHKGLNRALTEHELDDSLIPDDWWEPFINAKHHACTGKWLVGPTGYCCWDGEGNPPGVTDEDVINRSAGVVRTFGYRKA